MELSFVTGGAIRKVFINGRTLSLVTPELNFQPFTINLNKLDEEKDKIKKMKINMEVIEKIALLETEQEIAKDIKRDFQHSGWRLISIK